MEPRPPRSTRTDTLFPSPARFRSRFDAREALADELERRGFPRPVGLWLAMNLEREGEGFRWKLDWDGVEEMLRDYFVEDVWPVIEGPPPDRTSTRLNSSH